MIAVLRSVLIWLAIAVLTFAWFCLLIPVAVVAFPFDRKKNAPHYVARGWARMLLRINPACSIRVEGTEHLAAIGGNGAAVLCANHQSMADIIALYYLGYPFKWISKKEIAYVPIIGWAMWMAGYIFLKRGDKTSTQKMFDSAHAWLDRGVSIMMFPEGTRSHDGRIKAFKDGAFRMSVDAGRPVVPIALTGARDLVQKGSWKFAAKTDIVVRVGPPILPAAGAEGQAEIARLREATREWILANVAEISGVPASELDAGNEVARFGNKTAAARV